MIDFKEISKSSNKTYLICDKLQMEIDDSQRSMLLNADVYVTYNIKPEYINKEVAKDFITRYLIVEKILDEKNNLILLAEESTIDL